DLLEQDDLHVGCAPSVEVGVRQEFEEPRTLDRSAELALITGLRAGDPRGYDLAILLHEVLQDVDVLVVDLLDVLRGEAAELLALEQVVAALAAASVLLELSLALASPHGTWHVEFLSVCAMNPARSASRSARGSFRCGNGGRRSLRI